MIEIITTDITKLEVDATPPPPRSEQLAVAWMERSTVLQVGNYSKPAVNSTAAKPVKPASHPDSIYPQSLSYIHPDRSGTAASATKPNFSKTAI